MSMLTITAILGDGLNDDRQDGASWILEVMSYAMDAGFRTRRVRSVDTFDNCVACRCPVPVGHYIFIYKVDESHILCFECVEAGYILDRGKQPPALLEKYRDKGEN